MNKTIEYYMNLPYTRELIPEASGIWFVRVKELPNCMSQGNSPEEALHMIDDAMRGWLEVELEDGESIPEPREEEEYSGKFNTRVPKSLHRKLVEAAEREGVSLNQWINTSLAEAVGASAVRSSMKATKIEEPSTAPAWPGLAGAIQRVLEDVGIRHEAGMLDEQLFAVWLEQNQEEILIECQRDDYEQALSKTRALSTLLQEHQTRSPVIHSICKILVDQARLLEQTHQMNLKVLAAEQLQEQIGAILNSVNSQTLGQMRGLEKERHATTTSRHEVQFSIPEPALANEW